MSQKPIAGVIASRWGLAGSANLVQWALLAALLALLFGLAGGWWIGDSLQEGQQAKAEVKAKQKEIEQANATVREAARQIRHYDQALQAGLQDRQALVEQFQQIQQEFRHDRQADREQTERISRQLHAALAARPDLRAVRVGPDVLQAWNDANRGSASGAAGPAAAAGSDPQRAQGAVPAGTAPGKKR